MKRPYLALTTLLLAAVLLHEGCAPGATTEQQQYYANGLEMYKEQCANCHGDKGEGVGGLYPPVANSSWLREKGYPGFLCALKLGLKDSIEVNGKTYNQPMPAHSTLSDMELVSIMVYVGNSWKNELGALTQTELRAMEKRCLQ